MITTLGRLLARRHWWPASPLSTPLDLVGLVITVMLASSVQQPRSHAVAPGEFTLLLLVLGGIVRIFLGQRRTVGRLLRKPRPILLIAPTVTATCAILVQAMGNSYYSLPFAGLFVALWTGWILVTQVVLYKYQAPLRVLLIEPAGFRALLMPIRRLDISVRASPPEINDEWDLVVVDPARLYSPDWRAWLAYSDMTGTRSLTAPLLIENLAHRMPLDILAGEWSHEIFRPRPVYASVKRVADTALIVLISPLLIALMAVLYLLVLLDDGRPVLFWQSRVGLLGKPFRMLKFRTMHTESEQPDAVFASDADPRITRLGKLLRKFRLDELPQVWNVLRGEMSIVGPRPEQTELANRFGAEIPMYDLRHNVPPGITGWAQVMQGYADTIDTTRDKLCFDLYYVRRSSPQLDLWIMLKTVRTVLTGFGSR